ncbi:hypothetical protein FHS04_002829 [Mesoflavibacter sabulilitoris]|uniref:Uncharacterized protein n=1 Tax=Mesoflavibacter zeaxanthinifaciens subsp. sabulilitoris TaxID=1520893 RepID=A0A2T1NNQ1_9FLAO|nr:hypothetical protein [Mesoflavibacter zeaxanthinifaciens]MBB3125285.1 hypothetical protein [Mesoflavibacter zeaxanthinifaciens subsp. sabulilitoris]PSG94520.1 hypothetical protein C7H61_00875 [Mesoflavibacter zeaxanthinifaciens subsp. sabulilitoris]
MNKLYVLTHLYDICGQDVFFISNEEPEIIFKKAIFIQLRAEAIIDESKSISTRNLASILFKHIEAIEIPFKNESSAFRIDMYELRESFCSITEDLKNEMQEHFNLQILDEDISNSDDTII